VVPKHILVVDDQKGAADISVAAILKFGQGEFTAEAVYGGRECLARTEKEPLVDLILLDLNMPEVNGADVIRSLLKKNPAAPLKILVTTAWGPGWISHWNLTDIHKTSAFNQLVCSGTCDKSDSMSDMVDQIRQVLGMDVSEGQGPHGS
jgi:DNA-binding NarL/FixJ family response regulator